MAATTAEGDAAARAVDAQVQASVLRSAEMFALTKRSTLSGLDFAPRYGPVRASGQSGVELVVVVLPSSLTNPLACCLS